MGPEPKKTILSIPAAIIFAGALITGAVMLASGESTPATKSATVSAEARPSDGTAASLDFLIPVSGDDHILGNPNASVTIVEHSDTECPFCKRFHSTMKRVIGEYGKSGKVAWVYRHFPLDSIHSKARPEAVAAECANKLGGNAAFWKYVDRFFELTPSNNQTDIDTVLPQIGREIGLDETDFASCRASGEFDAHIQEDLDNAIATGGEGTPWSIIITASGKKYPLSGAQPYAAVKQLIELALQEK